MNTESVVGRLVEHARWRSREAGDVPCAAFHLAWRAYRLLEKVRDLRPDGLCRGRGIPGDPVTRFACKIVEDACRLPAHGVIGAAMTLHSACSVAWSVARALRWAHVESERELHGQKPKD